MPNVRIRIGASVEADFGALVFRPLVEQAKAARAAVRKELDGIGADMAKVGLGGAGGRRRSRDSAAAGMAAATGGGSGPYRGSSGDGASDGPLRRRQRANREMETEEERHHREMERKRREDLRAQKKALKDAEREAEASEQKRTNQWVRAAGGAGMGTIRGTMGMARSAAGIANDIAAGAGVQFNLGNAVQSRFDLEKRATDLSNAAYMPGAQGAAGARQDPRELMREVQTVADATATDTNKAMEGLQAFVGKTGDLSTGRAVLKDMAMLARATGGELQDIVSAAGDVSANLGEVGEKFATADQKGRAVSAVMAALAAQGKVGAVEMKDLSVQMAKLASSAPQFAGSVENNMASMGALAQMARAKGGAASATQATTSVQGFVNTFGKAARRKEFKAAGVGIEDATGALLDPEEIIVNALKATGGSKAKMNKLFMDAGAQRVTNGFRNIYTQAEAQQKGSGEAKVREEFAKLKKASMGPDERDASFNASMNTGEAKAQLLKNQIEKQLGDAVERVAPKMMELAPRIGDLTVAFGNMVGWAASNPLKATFAAIGVSAAKAVGEAALRVASERVTETLSKGGASALGSAGLAGLTIMAAAVTLYAMNELNEADKKKKETAKDSTEAMLANATKISNQINLERAKEQSAQLAINEETAKPEDKRDKKRLSEAEVQRTSALARQEELRQQAADLQGQLQGDLDNAQNVDQAKENGGMFFGAKSVLKTAGFNVEAPGRTEIANAEATNAKLAEVKAAVDSLKSALTGGIPVTVKNLPGPGVPGVNPAGRAGPGQ